MWSIIVRCMCSSLLLAGCRIHNDGCWMPPDKYDYNVTGGQTLIAVIIKNKETNKKLIVVTTNQYWKSTLLEQLKFINRESDYTKYMHDSEQNGGVEVTEEYYLKIKDLQNVFEVPVSEIEIEKTATVEYRTIVDAAKRTGKCQRLKGISKDSRREWFTVARLLLENGLVVSQGDFDGKWWACFAPVCN